MFLILARAREKKKKRKRKVPIQVEMNPNPRAQSFPMPEPFDVSDPECWRKRINREFVEDNVKNFQRKRFLEVEEALLLGMTSQDRNTWHTL